MHMLETAQNSLYKSQSEEDCAHVSPPWNNLSNPHCS